MKTFLLILAFALICIPVRCEPSNVHNANTENPTIASDSSNLLQDQQCIQDSSLPWMPVDFVYSLGVQQLHEEIEQFYNYMKPTPIENVLRMRVSARIKSVVQQVLPNAQVRNHGSSDIGLVLPNGDIDLKIIGPFGQSAMHLLADKILASGIAEPNSLHIREDYLVPLIEFTERESHIDIDMPFSNEAPQVSPLMSFYQKYPALVKLMFVLKQFVKQRDLNDIFTGGIPSFALTLMCISFLQHHPTYKPNEDVNLGSLLFGFFELYGRKFDYGNTGITIRNGGAILPRSMLPCDEKQLFCIEDPVDTWMNVCSNSYRTPDVKQAFEDAYAILSTAISSSQISPNECARNSVLGRIVHVSNDTIKYRKWVTENFGGIILTDIIANRDEISKKK